MRSAFAITPLIVSRLQFPTFLFGFNDVLVGLSGLGLILFVQAPMLWRASKWKLSRPS